MVPLLDLPTQTWSSDRTVALTARCRGSLLSGWAESADRRGGAGTADDLTRSLAELGVELPRSPSKESWHPVSVQLLLTERILSRHFGGDATSFVEALIEDTARQTPRAAQLALKLGGFSTMLRFAPRVHPEAYDEGALEVKVGQRVACFSYLGSPAFAHPLFGFLQGAALLVLANATGKVATVEVAEGSDSCEVVVCWK